MPRTFEKDHGPGKVLYDWWSSLDDDRAARAVLRRAPNITAVALAAPYQRLYRRLSAAGWTKTWRNDALAAVVGILAHVRSEPATPTPVAATMSAAADGSNSAAVSELRFTRLLESPDLDTLFTGLRRVLPLLGHGVDVLALANDVVEWGDRVKKDWAYGYHWPTNSNH